MKKSEEASGPRVRAHFCTPEFERQYLAQYELRDHKTMRRWTLDEIREIRRTHGHPETASPLTGPPPDIKAQIKAMKEHFEKRKAVMDNDHRT